MMDYDFCPNGFHEASCPDCYMSSADRDDPIIATNAAINYGDGYQQAVHDLVKRLPRALAETVEPAMTWLSMWRFDPQAEDPWPRLAEAVVEALNDEEGLAEAFRRAKAEMEEVDSELSEMRDDE